MTDAEKPDHPVLPEVAPHWHKLCALALYRCGLTDLEISSTDLERFLASERTNIVIHSSRDLLTLSLVTDAEADRLVREKGARRVEAARAEPRSRKEELN